MWQEAQGTLACPFVNRKPVCAWSKVASSHVFIPWHVSQVDENFAVTWLGMLAHLPAENLSHGMNSTALTTLKLSCRGALVAGIAFQRRMSTHQRKAVKVILNRLHRNVPAVHRVALLAIGAELSPVDVSVAIRACGAHICEHQLRVALNALNFLVHPPERIASLIVVKFRDGANGLPAGGGVAIFARNVDRPVRIARTLDLRRTRRTLGKGLKCQHQQDL